MEKNERIKNVIDAKSKEEVRELLGADASEEQVQHVWQDLESFRSAEGLTALDDNELDTVSGGVLGFGNDAEDGHEKTCIWQWH